MSLDPVTVLVSAAGAPGTAALVRALRENGERELRLVGTDMSERSVGRHLCDAFHLVPSGANADFADAILDVVEREGVERRPPAVVARPRRARGAPRAVPVPRPRLAAGRDPPLERQGRDVRVPPSPRRPSTRISPRQRRNGGRERRPRARLSGPTRVFQARLLVGLARLPCPRPDRRSRAPAAARAAGSCCDAPRGGGRAPSRRGRA